RRALPEGHRRDGRRVHGQSPRPRGARRLRHRAPRDEAGDLRRRRALLPGGEPRARRARGGAGVPRPADAGPRPRRRAGVRLRQRHLRARVAADPLRMRRAAALVLAVAAAGCGSSSANQANGYVDAVNRAQSTLTTTLGGLSGRISDATTPEQDRRTLQAYDAALAKAVAALRSITPPSKVGDLHRRLVGDLDGYGREVR